MVHNINYHFNLVMRVWAPNQANLTILEIPILRNVNKHICINDLSTKTKLYFISKIWLFIYNSEYESIVYPFLSSYLENYFPSNHKIIIQSKLQKIIIETLIKIVYHILKKFIK